MPTEQRHRFLLLPKDPGEHINDILTLIFMVMLLTVLVLWRRKQWNFAKQNFKVKEHATWRRKNYDRYRDVGFYMILPWLVITIMILAFTYEWVSDPEGS